jgi:UrcA family protein
MMTLKGTLLAAALLVGATSALAIEPVAGSVSIEREIVRFDDLDLASRAGVATLHFRLRVAASNVCIQDQDLTGYRLKRKCRTQAMERALAAVPAVVAAYHAEWKADGANWLAVPAKSAPTQLVAAH